MNGRTSSIALALVCAAALACERTARSKVQGPSANGAAWFEEVAEQRGLTFVYRSGHRDKHLLPEIVGGGAALFDMDEDGNLDAFLVQGGNLTGAADEASSRSRLFRNRGNGTFEDVTAGSGADAAGYGMGVAVGDYDNDGHVDLYVTRLGSNVLLRNDGHGHFSDATRAAGMADSGWSTSAAFVDIDGDGDLDLFVVHYINWSLPNEHDCLSVSGARDYCSPRTYDAPTPATLFRNNGGGRFTDISEAAGLHTAFGNGLGVVAGDFDGDGRIDIFVANDGMPNQLWHNEGGGRFRDIALVTGCAVDQDGKPKAGMGVHAVDVDGDGRLDLLVVNRDGESDSFYRNEGRYFTDETALVGLGAVNRPFTRFGAALIDFDNDGALDVYEANGRVGRQSTLFSADPFAEPNVLFRGLRGRFREVRPQGGTVAPVIATSRAAAFGDIDNDGGLDILVVNRDAPASLLRNVVSPRGHWIGFRVVEQHQSDALGAEVNLSVAGRRITRDVRAAYSYLASNDPRVHVGLGEETRVADVSVRWPDGEQESFGAFAVDKYVTLRRGAGKAAGR